MLHDFLYVKITILYAISTHKNSVIITEKTLFEMHQYDIKKCYCNMAVFAVKWLTAEIFYGKVTRLIPHLTYQQTKN